MSTVEPYCQLKKHRRFIYIELVYNRLDKIITILWLLIAFINFHNRSLFYYFRLRFRQTWKPRWGTNCNWNTSRESNYASELKLIYIVVYIHCIIASIYIYIYISFTSLINKEIDYESIQTSAEVASRSYWRMQSFRVKLHSVDNSKIQKEGKLLFYLATGLKDEPPLYAHFILPSLVLALFLLHFISMYVVLNSKKRRKISHRKRESLLNDVNRWKHKNLSLPLGSRTIHFFICLLVLSLSFSSLNGWKKDSSRHVTMSVRVCVCTSLFKQHSNSGPEHSIIYRPNWATSFIAIIFEQRLKLTSRQVYEPMFLATSSFSSTFFT